MSQQSKHVTIGQCIRDNLAEYFVDLEGESPTNVYAMVIEQVEKALIELILERCEDNQTRAAKMLGISRSSLRMRMNRYRLIAKG
ncbi:MAG: helix-turn-helix domain-containing protein [Neisseriaceae bacterium]